MKVEKQGNKIIIEDTKEVQNNEDIVKMKEQIEELQKTIDVLLGLDI